MLSYRCFRGSHRLLKLQSLHLLAPLNVVAVALFSVCFSRASLEQLQYLKNQVLINSPLKFIDFMRPSQLSPLLTVFIVQCQNCWFCGKVLLISMFRPFIQKKNSGWIWFFTVVSTASVFSEIKETTYINVYYFYTVRYDLTLNWEVSVARLYNFSIRIYFTYTTGYSTVKEKKKIFWHFGHF